ncbi:GGDEF domain-containing protein [Candidatus Colwellia aromaticivorans]|uniref:GGDEF domain-containing protein n=1 Tax=Candidatus Colwellia aromaticivorans TaxID=2267621 RepID=UPI001FECBD58|nr:GGDEF domain-containing protein [Candidatus Colwellia aromaticivorans]
MTDQTLQCNELLFQGLAIGFIICLVVMLIIAYTFYRKYSIGQKSLKGQLTQAKNAILAAKNSYQLLLNQQQESQDLLEERVQERTLELHIALQELEEANRELEQKNTLDELTGLFNRRFYDQKILAEYRRSKRNLTPLSLIIIDIDHFKAVNDSYGHLAGDQCLIWLSKHLQKSLKRGSDMAFRYGGEEFCVILPDTDAKGAMTLAEALRKNIERQVCTHKEFEISLTISSGICTYIQQDDVQPEQIFTRADTALYEAKHNGRNQTKVYKDRIE